MTQIENITQMENRLNALRSVIDELTAAAEKYAALQPDFDLLSEYYGSKLWFKDFDDSNAGKLPEGLPCGVLSEDAVYDLIGDNNAMIDTLQEILRKSEMSYEISCGAVVFTRIEGEIKYVIIRSNEGWYGFPKGHTEELESEEETALREILEETGLKVTLLPGFKTVDEHGIPNKPEIIKRCIYFAAEYSGQEIQRQDEELSEALLMSYDEAMGVFQFESSRRILKEVNDFLTK
ncbi:MAG: DUF4298 domain-containing protein [Oscillospiraceae bacterium]|nr:DUF4298 domain-containing protein [Oscillospiraceae bacterium]